MRQVFLQDSDRSAPEVWRQAFPEAEVVDRSPTGRINDLLWVRLRAAEPPAEAIARARTAWVGVIVALSDTPDAEEAARSIAAGAAGYCNSRAAPEVLQQVAAVVGNGGLWVGQSLLQHLMRGVSDQLARRAREADGPSWQQKLSPREIEVARMVAAGSSNKEIAHELAITERTVKAHLGLIFEKLGVRDRLQLSLRVNGVNL